MNSTRTRLRSAAFLLAAGLLCGAAVIGLTSAASAHTNVGHAASCESVSGSFSNFPGGTNSITVHGDGATVVRSFSGSSGSVVATWSALGVDVTKGGDHTYSFTWSADGGGASDVFHFDATGCVPTPTTEPPTTTVPDETTTTTTQPHQHPRPTYHPKPEPEPTPAAPVQSTVVFTG